MYDLLPIIEFSSPGYLGNTNDFCGFHFNGISSNSMGIKRVSGGSRYEEGLMPSVENKTVSVPGGHGYYFFGSYYRDRTFSVSIAYDSLTEEQFRNLKTIFSPCNELYELWFDERPYVGYWAKISQPISLKYICFDEGTNHRVYKGEGTIQFQCFNPFGHSRFHYLKDYEEENPEEMSEEVLEEYINEWGGASRMAYEQTSTTETLNKFQNGVCTVYNPGDLETSFNIILRLDEIEQGDVYLRGASVYPWRNANLGTLILENVQSENSLDVYIRINSKLNLIEGLDFNKEPTGTLYNKYISAGDFFNLPVNKDLTDTTDRSKLYIADNLKDAYALCELSEVAEDELREDKDYTLEIESTSISTIDFNFNYKYL